MEEVKKHLIDLTDTKKTLVTNRAVLIRFCITSRELTDCSLNPFNELRALDYALQKYCNKSKKVDSCYLFFNERIDYFQQESYALWELEAG